MLTGSVEQADRQTQSGLAQTNTWVGLGFILLKSANFREGSLLANSTPASPKLAYQL
jgi:hypothetical protein